MVADRYPPAERVDIVDRLHGQEIPDPYRWLEDAADPRTLCRSAAQDEQGPRTPGRRAGARAPVGHTDTIRTSCAGCRATPGTTMWLKGSPYPAVLFTTFGSDTRVDPRDARKMCAALQHATVAAPEAAPIVLRRETDVGHASRSVSRTVALAADQLTFLADHTGLDLEVLPA